MGKHGKRPDKECNMKCKHDNSRMCGAGWRNNIFKLVVTPKAYKPIYGESVEGCYRDKRDRDLPNLLKGGEGDPSKCFKLAMDAGYQYAAF